MGPNLETKCSDGDFADKATRRVKISVESLILVSLKPASSGPISSRSRFPDLEFTDLEFVQYPFAKLQGLLFWGGYSIVVGGGDPAVHLLCGPGMLLIFSEPWLPHLQDEGSRSTLEDCPDV